MSSTFHTIIADPPWKFRDSLPSETRGASKQYTCMDYREIMRFPLPPIADDAKMAECIAAHLAREVDDDGEPLSGCVDISDRIRAILAAQ